MIEKIIAKNKSEFGAKKRELISTGYTCIDREKFSDFALTKGFKRFEITLIKGWKK